MSGSDGIGDHHLHQLEAVRVMVVAVTVIVVVSLFGSYRWFWWWFVRGFIWMRFK